MKEKSEGEETRSWNSLSYLSLGEGLFAQTAEWTANTLPKEQVNMKRK